MLSGAGVGEARVCMPHFGEHLGVDSISVGALSF